MKSSAIQKRQSDGEHCSVAGRAVHLDRAAVILNDLLGYIETKAGAALALLRRKVRIKDLADLRGIDTRSAVLDSNIDVELFASAFDQNGPLLFRRGLDGIDDNVLNRAMNLDGIAHQQAFLFANVRL